MAVLIAQFGDSLCGEGAEALGELLYFMNFLTFTKNCIRYFPILGNDKLGLTQRVQFAEKRQPAVYVGGHWLSAVFIERINDITVWSMSFYIITPSPSRLLVGFASVKKGDIRKYGFFLFCLFTKSEK